MHAYRSAGCRPVMADDPDEAAREVARVRTRRAWGMSHLTTGDVRLLHRSDDGNRMKYAVWVGYVESRRTKNLVGTEVVVTIERVKEGVGHGHQAH